MIKFLPGEEWKEIQLPDKLKFRYAISNKGRIMSFTDSFDDGRVLNVVTVDGYSIFRYKLYSKEKIVNKHFFVRKLVADYFLPPPPSPAHTFVILIDRNRTNNKTENLKWATRKEMIEHFKRSPYVIKARLIKKRRGIGQKLTSTKVQLIKQKIFDPNRKTRLKIIARQFGITSMQLYRIQSGENWGHISVTVDGKSVTRKENGNIV